MRETSDEPRPRLDMMRARMAAHWDMTPANEALIRSEPFVIRRGLRWLKCLGVIFYPAAIRSNTTSFGHLEIVRVSLKAEKSPLVSQRNTSPLFLEGED